MTDVVVAGDYFVSGGHDPTVDEGVRELASSATYALVNLEAPVTETDDRIEKSGPHLMMPPSSLRRVREAGFTVAMLANEHILDAGATGVSDTLLAVRREGMLAVGATAQGGAAREASRLRLPFPWGSLTVLNYCEHGWSVRDDGVGASGWDPLDAYSDVRQAREDGDRVLIVLHGGNEYFPLPRPGLRKQLRFLAENGADAVVMHHSHVPGAYEVWHGVPIFYGLGNLQLTLSSPYSGWYEGVIVKLDFPEASAPRFELVPTWQDADFGCSIAVGGRREEILNQLEGYRIQVTSDAALRARWLEFVRDSYGGFVRGIAPTSMVPRGVRTAARLMFSHLHARDVAAGRRLLDYVRCESHGEALLAGIADQLSRGRR